MPTPYDILFRAVLSKLDPERAHGLASLVIRAIPAVGLGGMTRRSSAISSAPEVHTMGLVFPSAFGLAAGFDKDARYVAGLGALGFGHVEVGTLTPRSQPGNERPRLFRLVKDKALINRMGFNNGGASAAALRIAKLRRGPHSPIVGANIGKNRATAVEDAAADYVASARILTAVADYLVVNVSSPNTPGLRGLQELEQLAPLLRQTKEAAGATPLLVKIAPDLSDAEVSAIADLAAELQLAGIIATNTTIDRSNLLSDAQLVDSIGAGGLSGAPLADRSLEVLKLIRTRVPQDMCVISVGGVTTANDVAERLAAGATLVQGYTAFLYQGPFWARTVNRGLARPS